MRFQLLGSRSQYPADIAADFEQPMGAVDDLAYMFEYVRDSRNRQR